MGNSQCIFCNIVEKKQNILFEDDLVVIFKDIYPCASVHLQAVPKKHIKNINYLTKEDINLIKHMKLKSLEYLTENYGEDKDYT